VERGFHIDRDQEIIDSVDAALGIRPSEWFASPEPRSASRQRETYIDVSRIDRVDRLQYAEFESDQVMPTAAKVLKEVSRTYTPSKKLLGCRRHRDEQPEYPAWRETSFLKFVQIGPTAQHCQLHVCGHGLGYSDLCEIYQWVLQLL